MAALVAFIFRNTTKWYGNAVISNYETNDWSHLVGVYDGSSMKIYHDGSFINKQSGVPSVINEVADNLLIGDRWQGGTPPQSPFNGSIDDVRIYNTSLIGGEVLELYLNSGRVNINLTIPVFLFHSVNETGICQGAVCYINQSEFTNFVVWMNESGYETITDVELSDKIDSESPLESF